eukprot:TRINITY_DN4279_c0_g1_i1.p1 TRINITY_DN4279_c0_g1~~TRINITY_DN4279_c0_g1_i1.p1  ORF type:complete len:767 (-),score=153.56 TRINITY_DN4279_c0_g1_i1:58-2358(-)
MFALVCLLLVGSSNAFSLTPNNTICPAGFECASQCEYYNRNNVILPCGKGYHCPADTLPTPCPRGFYCDEPGDSPIRCAEGFYCPQKSSMPRKCPPLAYCPAQAHRHYFWGVLLYIFIVIVYLKSIHWAFHHFNNKKQLKDTDIHTVLDLSPSLASARSESDDHGLSSMNFVYQDVKVRIRPGSNIFARLLSAPKTILQGATGALKSGRFVAIMGPSGAGKSSLMNALLGKISLSGGSIKVNGHNLKTNMKKSIGFVPQDDVMLTNMTVRNVLMHSALTRLPTSYTLAKRTAVVDEVIQILQLEGVENTIIGDNDKRGISGGERKRVNVGIELVSEPRALFLDEPTTGLDSAVAKDLCQHLKNVTRKRNLTTVAVLHQPRYDIFLMYDDVILLGRGGRTVYSGPANRALEYFSSIGFECPEHVNPADFYLDVISGLVPHKSDGPVDLFKIWEEHQSEYDEMRQKISEEFASTKGQRFKAKYPNSFWQFLVFLKRALLQNIYNWNTRTIDCALNIAAGIVVGIAFFSTEIYQTPIPTYYREFCLAPIVNSFCGYSVDEIPRMGIYLVMSFGIVSSTIALRTFLNERLVFWREAASGSNRLAYFLAKNLADIEPMVVNTWMFTAAFYFVAAPSGNFGDYFVTLFLYAFCLYAIGYICTWIPPQPALLAVIVSLVSGLGTGATSSVQDMGFSGTILWARWFGEAIYITEVRQDYIDPSYHEYMALWADRSIGYKLDNFGHDLWAMAVIGIALRVIAFGFMTLTNRSNQK